jgi:hypothetical protein
MWRPLADGTKLYRHRVKPFNFALSAHVAPFGRPPGANPERFHLLAPYERDARKWLELSWTDVNSGSEFRITTAGPATVGPVAVKSYRGVLESYATHPEEKSAGPDGLPCGPSTVGLLRRRPVHASRLEYIGKESRRIEELETGQLHDLSEVVAHFPDADTEWRETLLPVLLLLPTADAARRLDISKRAVSNLRTGRSKPGPRVRERMRELATELATLGVVIG